MRSPGEASAPPVKDRETARAVTPGPDAVGGRDPANENARAPDARARRIAAALALGLAVLSVYAGRLAGPFVFDDEEAITANPTLRDFGSLAVFAPPRETPVAARPLVNLSFALDHALFGLSPAAFHATNLALHVLVALLAFACLRRLFGAASIPAIVRARAAAFAWTAALLFAVHPLASEVVLYTSQRTEGLVAVWYLLALWLVISAASGGIRARGWLAALIGLLGGASKEVFATAPIVALFLDRAFYAGSFALAWRCRAPLYLGLASCLPLLAALQLGDPRPDSVRFGELSYLLAQARVVPGYFGAALWPSALAIDHGPLPAALDVAALVPAAALLATAVSAGGALAFLRPKLGFLAIWVFGILAPSSSLFAIHTEVGADRRFYLPLIGLIAYAVVGAGVWLLRAPTPLRRALAIGAAACLALALAATTRVQASRYASVRAVWRQVVAVHPENARGHYNLGETYRREGDHGRALESLRAAIALDPSYADAHANLGSLLVERGMHAEGLRHLRRTVELAPGDATVYFNLGVALALSGRTGEALAELERAVRRDPARLDVRRKLASAYLALGRPAEARAHAERLLQQHPMDPTAQRILRATAAD